MKLYDEKEKMYIGKAEALEIALSRRIYELPRKGKEIITCRQVGLGDSVLGKDSFGYYNIEKINQQPKRKCKCNLKKGIVCDKHFFPQTRRAYKRFLYGVLR